MGSLARPGSSAGAIHVPRWVLVGSMTKASYRNVRSFLSEFPHGRKPA
jgi:hypothetical protein